MVRFHYSLQMAKMLRTGASGEFGHCDFCDRKNKTRKGRKRERHTARAREKAQLRRDYRLF